MHQHLIHINVVIFKKLRHACLANFCHVLTCSLPFGNEERQVEMQLDSTNFEIKGSGCGFLAGCGRCKHVAALCELQSLPDFQSVTKHLPTWNQPKAKKLNPLPVISLQTRKEELLPPTKHSLTHSLTHALQSTGKLTEKYQTLR